MTVWTSEGKDLGASSRSSKNNIQIFQDEVFYILVNIAWYITSAKMFKL